MKTKTQLKNTSSKRSIAMKKSWAERRNSPGRKLARERQAKKVTQRVTLVPEATLASIAQSLNEIRSMVAYPPKSSQPVGVRRMIATHMMAGLLAGSLTNPLGGDSKAWAKKAYEFADALIEAEGQ